MQGYVKIKVSSKNLNHLNSFLDSIKDIAEKTGVEMKGPIPLPVKRLTFSIRKSPDGQGTETFERWEMRIHKRIIYLKADARIIKAVAKLPIPEDVQIEMKFI
jgi:small subunit ribosomal protein S10